MTRVSAVRAPVRCVPPSGVLMVLAKAYSLMATPSVYCMATSTSMFSSSLRTCTGSWSALRLRFR